MPSCFVQVCIHLCVNIYPGIHTIKKKTLKINLAWNANQLCTLRVTIKFSKNLFGLYGNLTVKELSCYTHHLQLVPVLENSKWKEKQLQRFISFKNLKVEQFRKVKSILFVVNSFSTFKLDHV